MVEVEVDPVTYETNVLGVWAYDIGTPIDEKLCRAIEGGRSKASVMELEVLKSKEGDFCKAIYGIISCRRSDFPKIESKLLLNPYATALRGSGTEKYPGQPRRLGSGRAKRHRPPVRQIPITPSI